MEISVSIIVPIYKVEKYLKRCVDSLLNQTLQNIEIILVDDGSPDRCGEIADEYAEIDTRIRVVHQSNQGLGPARNSGMRIAKGQYIGFVDSDDYVAPEMYKKLFDYAQMGDFDIVTGGYTEFSNAQLITRIHPYAGREYRNKDDINKLRKKLYGHLQKLDGKAYYPVAAWCNIYKRDIIERYQLSFCEVLSEDIIFNLDYYSVANSIAFISTADYYYRKEGQPSITHSFSENKLGRYRNIIKMLKDRVEKEDDRESYFRFKSQVADRCRDYARLINNSGASMRERKQYYKHFAEDPDIAECINNFPLKILPFKRRIFHWLTIHKMYGIVLILRKFDK